MHTPGASQRHVMAWSPAGSIPPLSPRYSLHSFYPSRRAASATYSALGRRSSRNDNRCLANAPQSHPLFHQTQTVCSLLRRAGFGCAAVKGGWCSPGHANENAQLRVGVGVADCFPRGAAPRGGILRPPAREKRARLVTGVRPRKEPGRVPEPEGISGNECGMPVSNHAS